MYIRNSIARKIYHILKRDANVCLLNHNESGIFRNKGTNKDCEAEDCEQVPQKHKKKSKFILWGKEEPQLGPTGKPIGIMDCIKHAPAIGGEESEKNGKEEEEEPKPDGPCRSPCEPREECKVQAPEAKGAKPQKDNEDNKVIQQQVTSKKKGAILEDDSKAQKQTAEKKDQPKVQPKEKEASSKDNKDCPPCPDVKPSAEEKTLKKDAAKPQQLLTTNEEKKLFKHPLVKKVEEAKKELKAKEMQQKQESKEKKEQVKSNEIGASPPKKDDCPPCPQEKPEQSSTQTKEESPSPAQEKKATEKNKSICPPPLKQQKQEVKLADKDSKKAGTPTSPRNDEKPPTPLKIEKTTPTICLKHVAPKVTNKCIKSKPPPISKPQQTKETGKLEKFNVKNHPDRKAASATDKNVCPPCPEVKPESQGPQETKQAPSTSNVTHSKEKQLPLDPKIEKSSNLEEKSSSQKKEKDKKDVDQKVCPICKSEKGDEKDLKKTVPPLSLKNASTKTDSTQSSSSKSKPAVPPKETNKPEEQAVKEDQKKALSTENKEKAKEIKTPQKEPKSSIKVQASPSAKEAKKDKEVCPPCTEDKTEKKSGGSEVQAKEDKQPEKKPSICPPPIKQLNPEERSLKQMDTKPERSTKPPVKKDTLNIRIEQKSCDCKSVTKSQSKGKASELERFCVKNLPKEESEKKQKGQKEQTKAKVKEKTPVKNVSADSKQVSPSIKEPSEDKKVCPPCKPKGKSRNKSKSQTKPQKRAPPKDKTSPPPKPEEKQKKMPVNTRVMEICNVLEAQMEARRRRMQGSRRCSPCAKREVPEPPESKGEKACNACDRRIKQPVEEDEKGCNETQKFITIYENPFPIEKIRTSFWGILRGKTELRNNDNYWLNTNSVFGKLEGPCTSMLLFSSENNNPSDVPPEDSHKDRSKPNSLNRIRSEIRKYREFLSKSKEEPKKPTQVKIPKPLLRNQSKEENVKDNQQKIKQLKAQQVILSDYIKYLQDTAALLTQRKKAKKKAITKYDFKQKSSSKDVLKKNKNLAQQASHTKFQKLQSSKDSPIKHETTKSVENLPIPKLKEPILKENLLQKSESTIPSMQMESISTPVTITAQKVQQKSDLPNKATVKPLNKSVVAEMPSHLDNNTSSGEIQSTAAPEKSKQIMEQSDLPNQTALQVNKTKATSDIAVVEPSTKPTVAEIAKVVETDAVINASSVKLQSTDAPEQSKQSLQQSDLPNQTKIQVNKTNATSDIAAVEPSTKPTAAEIAKVVETDAVINASSVKLQSTDAPEQSKQSLQQSDLPNQTKIQVNKTNATSDIAVVEPSTKPTAAEIAKVVETDAVINASSVKLQSTDAPEQSKQSLQQSDLPNQTKIQVNKTNATSDIAVVEPSTKPTAAEIAKVVETDAVINASSVKLQSTDAPEQSKQSLQQSDLPNQTILQIDEIKATSDVAAVEQSTKSTVAEIPKPLETDTVISASSVEAQSTDAPEQSKQTLQQSDLLNQAKIQVNKTNATSDIAVVEPSTKSTVAEIPKVVETDTVINASSVKLQSTDAPEQLKQSLQQSDLLNQTTLQVNKTNATSDIAAGEPSTKPTVAEIPKVVETDTVINASSVKLQSTDAPEQSKQSLQQFDLPNQTILQIDEIKATSDVAAVEQSTKSTVAEIAKVVETDAVISASSVKLQSTDAPEQSKQSLQQSDLPNQTILQIDEIKATSDVAAVEQSTKSTVAEIAKVVETDAVISASSVKLQSTDAPEQSKQTLQQSDLLNQAKIQVNKTNATSDIAAGEPSTKPTVAEIAKVVETDAVISASSVKLQSTDAPEQSKQTLQQSDLLNQTILQIDEIKATSDIAAVEQSTKSTVAEIPKPLGTDAVFSASSVEAEATAAPENSEQNMQQSLQTEQSQDKRKALQKLGDKSGVAVLRASHTSTHIVMLNKILPVLPNISLHSSDSIALIEMELVTTPESTQLKLSEEINETMNEADDTKSEDKSAALGTDVSETSTEVDQATIRLNSSETSQSEQPADTHAIVEMRNVNERPPDLVAEPVSESVKLDCSETTTTTQDHSAAHEFEEMKKLNEKSGSFVVEAPNESSNEGISNVGPVSNRSENDIVSVQRQSSSNHEITDNTTTKQIGEPIHSTQNKEEENLDIKAGHDSAVAMNETTSFSEKESEAKSNVAKLIDHVPIPSANNEEVQYVKQVVAKTYENILGKQMIPLVLREQKQRILEQSASAYSYYLDEPSVIKEELMTEPDKFVAKNETKVETNPEVAELPSISDEQHPNIKVYSKVANVQAGKETNPKDENIANLDLKVNELEDANSNLKLATKNVNETVCIVNRITQKPHENKETAKESDGIFLRISSLTPIIHKPMTRHLPNDVEETISSADEQPSSMKQISTQLKEQPVDLVNQSQHVTEETRDVRKDTNNMAKSSNDQQMEHHHLAESKDAVETSTRTENRTEETDDALMSSLCHLLIPIDEAQPMLEQHSDQAKKSSDASEKIKALKIKTHKKSKDVKVELTNEHVVKPSQEAEKIQKVESTEDMQKSTSLKVQAPRETKNDEFIQITTLVKNTENNIGAVAVGSDVMDRADRERESPSDVKQAAKERDNVLEESNIGAVKSGDPSKKQQEDSAPSSQSLKQTADLLIHASGKPKENVSTTSIPIDQEEPQPPSKCLQQTAALLSLASEKAKDILLDLENISKQKSKRINSTSLCLQHAAILLNQLSKKSNNSFSDSITELNPSDSCDADGPSPKCLQQTAALLTKASEDAILRRKAKVFMATAKADTMERIVMDMCILFSKYFKLTSYMLNTVSADPHSPQTVESKEIVAKLQNIAKYGMEQKHLEMSAPLSKYLKLTSNLIEQTPLLEKSLENSKAKGSDSSEVKELTKKSDRLSIELWALFSKYLRLTADLIEYVLKQTRVAEVAQMEANSSYIVHTTDSERIAPCQIATNPNTWRPLIKYVQLTSDLVNQISKDFKMIKIPEPRACPSSLSARTKSAKNHQEALEYFKVHENMSKQKEEVNSNIRRIPPFSNTHNKEGLNLVDRQNNIGRSWLQSVPTPEPERSAKENKIVKVNVNIKQEEKGGTPRPLPSHKEMVREGAPNPMQQVLHEFDQEVIAEVKQADMIFKEKKKYKIGDLFPEKTDMEIICSIKPPHIVNDYEFSKEWLDFVAKSNTEMEAQPFEDLGSKQKDEIKSSPAPRLVNKIASEEEPQKKHEKERDTDKNKEKDDSKTEKPDSSGEPVISSDDIHLKIGLPISFYIKDEDPKP